MSQRMVFLAVFVLISAVLALQGCREEDLARPDINSPPETILSLAPELGDQAFHKFRVRWTGLDRDGVVTGYKIAAVAEDELYGGRTSEEDISEYLVELPWRITDATESLFVFRADRPNSRKHSVYVVAIDNEGKEDPSPALTNFMAIDYELPVISIFIADNINTVPRVPGPKGDTLPAYNLAEPGEPINIELSWEGYDPDGEILEWRYRLDSSREVSVPPDTTAKTFVYDPSDLEGSDVWLGFHEFRLVAVDDANAQSPRKTARFVINYDPDTVIDSVWSYRPETNNSNVPPKGAPLPERLIFAREWRENPDSAAKYAGHRIGYHFGPLRMKFHAWDKDGPVGGAPPDSFKWSVQGTTMQGVAGRKKACGQSDTVHYYCTLSGDSPRLDNDRPFTLIFSAIDDRDKQDGSPDTVKFLVNFAPEIQSISHEFNASTGDVLISWEAVDIDEGYGYGDDREQAIMKYRLRYRLQGTSKYSQWIWQDNPSGREQRVRKYTTIEDLDSGTYELELRAYNGNYVDTRADTMYYEFSVP